jgi:hypothetical protein
MENTVIVGQQEAGKAYEVRRQLASIASTINQDTFAMARLLWTVRQDKMYDKWGFGSMKDYTEKELQMKGSKAQYLTRIIEVVESFMGMDAPEYEHVGISKLRAITRLDPLKHRTEINQLILEAPELSLKEIESKVKDILGLVGDNALITRSYTVTEAAYKVIQDAMELVRKQIGSKGRDEDGKAIEFSDGRCLELICADWLNDPNHYSPVESEDE